MPGAHLGGHTWWRAGPGGDAVSPVLCSAGSRKGRKHAATRCLRPRLCRERCVGQGQVQGGDGSFP
eukprot:5837508-Lingulodinium_polyedra.AAC.1